MDSLQQISNYDQENIIKLSNFTAYWNEIITNSLTWNNEVWSQLYWDMSRVADYGHAIQKYKKYNKLLVWYTTLTKMNRYDGQGARIIWFEFFFLQFWFGNFHTNGISRLNTWEQVNGILRRNTGEFLNSSFCFSCMSPIQLKGHALVCCIITYTFYLNY